MLSVACDVSGLRPSRAGLAPTAGWVNAQGNRSIPDTHGTLRTIVITARRARLERYQESAPECCYATLRLRPAPGRNRHTARPAPQDTPRYCPQGDSNPPASAACYRTARADRFGRPR